MTTFSYLQCNENLGKKKAVAHHQAEDARNSQPGNSFRFGVYGQWYAKQRMGKRDERYGYQQPGTIKNHRPNLPTTEGEEGGGY